MPLGKLGVGTYMECAVTCSKYDTLQEGDGSPILKSKKTGYFQERVIFLLNV